MLLFLSLHCCVLICFILRMLCSYDDLRGEYILLDSFVTAILPCGAELVVYTPVASTMLCS
jgi:hypothetical protein